MKCPKCQFENPEDSLFCGDCGAPLEVSCPNCGSTPPREFKFCNKCGHDLRKPSEGLPLDLSFDQKIEKIQKYLPQGLAEKILSQRDRIEGERKQVTVMFCDMEGFTRLSEKLDPEDAYTIMDKVYEILIHKVHDYEGTVNEMTGDGIMALFGAPIALEDAPQRAIRSSLSIHREVAKFNDRMKQEKDTIPPLKMRIGIHTGPVVVGTLGNDLRVEFKAVGDTVNLASRAEGLAKPGTTYITEDTFKLTEGFFRFEALGKRKIKGKEEPVQIYRAIAPSTRRTRFDVSAERGLTPFVGRDRELELLLDGFERAKEGRGQAFSIVAEAGLGKSRLLYEFRKAVINENATFMEGKCLSYSKNVAYHPLIDRLKSNFDIKEGAADSEIKEKVINGLKILGIDEASTLPYILELLAVKDSGIDRIQMSPEARKDRTMEAVQRITFRGSEIRPLILATEDLHWIDKSSEEYLKHLLDSISGSRIFLIFTYRPEYVHTWGAKSYHSQINLNRLSNRESLNMLSHLLGTGAFEKELAELLLAKTDGIPFFIEEFVKSLIQLKIIEKKEGRFQLAKGIQEVAIPATIQDVIMARVDSLADGAKEVLQTGTAIEREFDHKLIKHVMGLPEQELLSHMSALKDAELLYERGIFPDSTYIFKHALTREVVYDSLLTGKKKSLHEKIGNALEELYKESIGEQYGILIQHFSESENYQKAAEYSLLAGKRAEKTASLNDAIAYIIKGITCLEKLPRTDDVQKNIIDARTLLGLYYIQMSLPYKAKEAVDPIFNLVLESGYNSRISHIYTILGTHSIYIEEDLPKAVNYLEKALMISSEFDDLATAVLANWFLGVTLTFNCEFEKALHHMQKALDINIETNTLWGISLMKSWISVMIHCNQGNISLAYRTSGEAVQIAEESADIVSKASAYVSHGVSFWAKGLIEEGIELLLRGNKLCERINYMGGNYMADITLGEAYFQRGEYKKSQWHFEKAKSMAENSKFYNSHINCCKIGITRAKVMNNEKEINVEQLYQYVHENKFILYDGLIRRYLAEILINIDGLHLAEAEDWIGKAIEADNRHGMMFNLGQDHALYAELFQRIGDQSKARENLNKSIEIFKGCGADGWVEKYEKDLAALS
jgi:class 3 adenylate cyclase/tetratricopeptide (TPR) repeat protein